MDREAVPVLRILIVDDERLARDGLRHHLQRHGDLEVVGECANGRQAIEAIERLRPDLVFLDVQMPGLDGLGVVEQVGAARMPAVVFVTAYEEHALRAFEAHALDYLLKPIDRARLEEALRRARRRLDTDRLAALEQRLSAVLAEMGGATGKRPSADRFMVRIGDRMHVVPALKIDWIEADGDHVRLHVGANSYTLRATLTAIEAQLDPSHFLRIHRSTIVNVERVREVRPYANRELVVVLENRTRLKLSRSYRERFDSVFGDAS